MGIIRDYIYRYFKEIGSVSSFEEFTKLLFHSDNVSVTGSMGGRLNNDILPGFVKEMVNENEKEYLQLIKYYENELYDFIIEYNYGNFGSFYEILLEGIDLYIDTKKRNNLYEVIKKIGKNVTLIPLHNNIETPKVIENYLKTIIVTGRKKDCNKEAFAGILFSILYYLSYGFINQTYHSMLNRLEEDKKEYQEVIVDVFGYTADNAEFMIRSLAERERPNTIALNELGDIAFHGRGENRIMDKAKAYYYYQKAIEGDVYYPVAGWSLAYIQYYYQTNRMQNVMIPELEAMTIQNRKILAMQNMIVALECGFYWAANNLAIMVEDEDIPYYMKANLKTRLEYLELGAEHGIIFSINNLYDYYMRLSKEEKDPIKAKSIEDKAISYLKKALKYYEPWSLDEYGVYAFDHGDIDDGIHYLNSSINARGIRAPYDLYIRCFVPEIKYEDILRKYIQQDLISFKETLKELIKKDDRDFVKEYVKEVLD